MSNELGYGRKKAWLSVVSSMLKQNTNSVRSLVVDYMIWMHVKEVTTL